jgi:lipopolysaccharide/colanic/teichoic acid biosynthesis glycosyltransferase
MSISNKYEALRLFFGDLLVFVVSIWLSLFVRFGALPTGNLLFSHFIFFFPVFFFLISACYLGGLYSKRALILSSRLPALLFKSEVISGILAICYFYIFPELLISPKTILLLYVVISYCLELLWRRKSDVVLANRTRERALLIGGGEESRLLFAEVNGNPRYHITFVAQESLEQLQAADLDVIEAQIKEQAIGLVVADFYQSQNNPSLAALYQKLSGKVKYLHMHKLYEDVFDRIPLSLVSQHWFLENISLDSHRLYETAKRVVDVLSALVLGLLSLICYPFVFLAIKLDDRGSIFIRQERVGRSGTPITILKFRTMNETSKESPDKRITKVGRVLRSLRIDELPQLWNVLLGDLSLIGPRPELPALVETYVAEIPYYAIRHTMAPGLSGWAQVHQIDPPKFSLAIDQTKIKLSYDLYYLKNRSFFLDLIIAFKTIKTLLSRSGI